MNYGPILHIKIHIYRKIQCLIIYENEMDITSSRIKCNLKIKTTSVRNKGNAHLLNDIFTPKSVLNKINPKTFFNISIWNKLKDNGCDMGKLITLLPEHDQNVLKKTNSLADHKNITLPTLDSIFNNEYFNAALVHWKSRLKKGEFRNTCIQPTLNKNKKAHLAISTKNSKKNDDHPLDPIDKKSPKKRNKLLKSSNVPFLKKKSKLIIRKSKFSISLSQNRRLKPKSTTNTNKPECGIGEEKSETKLVRNVSSSLTNRNARNKIDLKQSKESQDMHLPQNLPYLILHDHSYFKYQYPSLLSYKLSQNTVASLESDNEKKLSTDPQRTNPRRLTKINYCQKKLRKSRQTSLLINEQASSNGTYKYILPKSMEPKRSPVDIIESKNNSPIPILTKADETTSICLSSQNVKDDEINTHLNSRVNDLLMSPSDGSREPTIFETFLNNLDPVLRKNFLTSVYQTLGADTSNDISFIQQNQNIKIPNSTEQQRSLVTTPNLIHLDNTINFLPSDNITVSNHQDKNSLACHKSVITEPSPCITLHHYPNMTATNYINNISKDSLPNQTSIVSNSIVALPQMQQNALPQSESIAFANSHRLRKARYFDKPPPVDLKSDNTIQNGPLSKIPPIITFVKPQSTSNPKTNNANINKNYSNLLPNLNRSLHFGDRANSVNHLSVCPTLNPMIKCLKCGAYNHSTSSVLTNKCTSNKNALSSLNNFVHVNGQTTTNNTNEKCLNCSNILHINTLTK